jgi:hypothetical protein
MNAIHADDKKFGAKKKSEGFREVSADKRFTTTLGAPSLAIEQEETEVGEGEKSSFWALLLLSIAANLATIGLLQLFFSDNGFLRLEWDSSYWFVYLLIALPLFFLGLKKAKKLL